MLILLNILNETSFTGKGGVYRIADTSSLQTIQDKVMKK